MARIPALGLLFLLSLVLLASTTVQAAYQLNAESRPEKAIPSCVNGTCNPFSSCFTWQNGNDILANYPSGVGPITTSPILTKTPYQSNFGFQYYLPWPSTDPSATQSGLLFSGHNAQQITFGSWFSVALLVHQNFPILYASTQVCNKLSLSIPFLLTDSNGASDSTQINVQFTVEETPNDACNWQAPNYVYPQTYKVIHQTLPTSGTYPDGWINAGLGVCPYGTDCTTATSPTCPGSCFGTCNSVTCAPGGGCSDRVAISGGYTDNHIFNLNSRQFFLAVVGFTRSSQYNPADVPIYTFTTVENSNNIAYLYARLIEICSNDDGCDDGIDCTIDSCLDPTDQRNIWGYTNKFCYHSYSNNLCTNGCATGVCTASGCNMNPLTTNTCPSLKCKSNPCVQNGGTYSCQPVSINPDPCRSTSNCPYSGECSTDGTSCTCYTTTTSTTTRSTTQLTTTTTKTTTTTAPTTTTTTTTTPLANAIIPKLRCVDCSSGSPSKCRVLLGYQIQGTVTGNIVNNTLSILPNSVSNFITISGSGVASQSFVDLGQPGTFTLGSSLTEFYSVGYIRATLPSGYNTITWTLNGFTSSVQTSSGCTAAGSCYNNAFTGEIISSLCSWVETDSSKAYSFWYTFTVADTPSCPGGSNPFLESLLIKLPRCAGGITVLSSADTPDCLSSRQPSPGGYITSASNPDTQISSDSCIFSDDGNMGSPMWDAFDIPLNNIGAGKTCTIGVRINPSVCGNIGYLIPGSTLVPSGRVSLISSTRCQNKCSGSNCNSWPVIGPLPTKCSGNQPPTCSRSQYFDVDTCKCLKCPQCATGSQLSTDSKDAGLCRCIACPEPTCANGLQPDYSNLCNGCINCKPTCACSYSDSGCPWRITYENNRCGDCYQCSSIPNKTLTALDPLTCTYSDCNPNCDPKKELTPNNLCASCIPCNGTAVQSTCPGNQSIGVSPDYHPCYCLPCSRTSQYCGRKGYTWLNPSNLCDSTCTPCPVCPGNSSYADTTVQCQLGATCVPCPTKPCSLGLAPDPTDLCKCKTCPACTNGTMVTQNSCNCTACPDKNCTTALKVIGSIDCTKGCTYGVVQGSSAVDLCADCAKCVKPSCPANYTYGANYCDGCKTPCSPVTCPSNQVLRTPSDTCSDCVACQGSRPSDPGYVSCPANYTLDSSTCLCVPCQASCQPPNQYPLNDVCKGCGLCSTSLNCPKNKTWDGVSYCNPCVDCPLITSGGCGVNQRFVASTQNNVCPTCENCTATYPVCGKNTQRDAVNLCQCNPCPVPSCPNGQYFDNNNYCAGCLNCTEKVCNSTYQQYVPASYQICQSCFTCTTPRCNAGYQVNQSDICSGCYKCIPGVNVPACSSGYKPNPNNNCECIACVPLTPAACSSVWQTKVSNDTCATSCVPCDPGCDYNTTKPDPTTNGCTCINCTTSGGGGTGKHIGDDVKVAGSHGVARAEVAEACCPDFYVIPNYCQTYRGLGPDFAPYQCDCRNCTEFMHCGIDQQLKNCSCVDCPTPACNSYNETVGASKCDPCVPCIEPVCAANSTRDGVASLCDPCRVCQVPNCPPNFEVNYTDLCSPCIPCDANKTVCSFGNRVNPVDSCGCVPCATTCADGEERVSDDPCDGCKPCPSDACPLNYTRLGVCQNCTECPIPQPPDNFQVNWTDVCLPIYPCDAEETQATCLGNWTVNSSNICQCIPCPEPVCGDDEKRTSDDFCDGCTYCPDPICPINETKAENNCDGCVPCSPPVCGPNFQVNWTDVCQPCHQCFAGDTVCPVNYTVNITDLCNCIRCPDPNCSGDFKYASTDMCAGCLRCIPDPCQTNYTRPEDLSDCDPCVPCPELTCNASTQLTIVENDCPICEPCVPGSNVPACPFGQKPDPADSCKCVECIPPVCSTNYTRSDNPCDPCVSCPEVNCTKNQTVFDTCTGCVPCANKCPPGTRYTDPSDICQGCSDCPTPSCVFGFTLASDLCSCTRCNVTTCPSGFELDSTTGCGCNKCENVVCPLGTILTVDGCNCETTTIYDEPNVTTTRCNQSSRDFCGICFGNNRTCIGCDGQIGGPRYIDACGVICGLGNTCPGCTGQTCNICTEKVDLCGVCGGNSTTCDGCDGVPASGTIYDICGVCAGNGTACLGCYGIPFGPPCPSGVTAGEAAAVSILTALASLAFIALALILWRMRSRPEILFQEWDNLIAEHLTEIQQNPLCTSNEPEVNPLFHHDQPLHN